MISLFTVVQFIPVIILVTLVIQQNHLLISLLALEGITLRLVLIVPLTLTLNIIPLAFLCVIILTMGACEARLGLALIVSASRVTGNDTVNSISVNKC
jgi:NADH-ubiquinone oxidoreductase chain 4L